jgi:hypothetical protein
VPSKNIAFYGAFSQEFYETKHVPEDRRSGRGNHLASRLLSTVDSHTKIPAEIIWDVVCRWQGMRLLFDLYCDSAIEYTNCTIQIACDLGRSPSSNQAIRANFSRGLPANPSSLLSNAASEHTSRERQQAYRRFYKALTTHWFAVETPWRVVTQSHNKVGEFGTAIDIVRTMWMEDFVGTLPEKLDVITIVNFVWDFLGRSVSQNRTYFPERDPRECQGEDPVDGLEFYSLNTLLCARPPDVIELFLASWAGCRWRFDHPRFLRRLGYFDAKVRIYPMQQKILDTRSLGEIRRNEMSWSGMRRKL